MPPQKNPRVTHSNTTSTAQYIKPGSIVQISPLDEVEQDDVFEPPAKKSGTSKEITSDPVESLRRSQRVKSRPDVPSDGDDLVEAPLLPAVFFTQASSR